MATFYRTSVYICIIIILFTLSINFVSSFNAFPIEEEQGVEGVTQENALEKITGMDDPNMNYIWLVATGVGITGAIFVAWLTKSIVPIGIFLFSEVFWTSWLRMNSVLNMSGWVPGELLVIFTVGVMFVFIAAVIGMFTGSG